MKKRLCNYLCYEPGTAGGHLHHCTRTARYHIPGDKYQDDRYVCGIHLKKICPVAVNAIDLKTGKEVNRYTLCSMGKIKLVEEDIEK